MKKIDKYIENYLERISNAKNEDEKAEILNLIYDDGFIDGKNETKNEARGYSEKEWEQIRKAYKVLNDFIWKHYKDKETPIFDLIIKIKKIYAKS